MEDENTTPAEQEQTEETDPRAEYEAKLAELEARDQSLQKKEADLQKGFRTISEREKALQEKPAETPETYDLDPAARATIASVAEEVARKEREKVEQEMFAMVADDFSREHGVTVEDLAGVLSEAGIQPSGRSVADFRKTLNVGLELKQLKERDKEAEKEALKQEALKELEEAGIGVESIRGGREAPKPAGDDWTNEDLSDKARIELIKQKNPGLIKRLTER